MEIPSVFVSASTNPQDRVGLQRNSIAIPTTSQTPSGRLKKSRNPFEFSAPLTRSSLMDAESRFGARHRLHFRRRSACAILSFRVIRTLSEESWDLHGLLLNQQFTNSTEDFSSPRTLVSAVGGCASGADTTKKWWVDSSSRRVYCRIRCTPCYCHSRALLCRPSVLSSHAGGCRVRFGYRSLNGGLLRRVDNTDSTLEASLR